MITLCERCCVPIADGEPVVRYAHIDRAHPDGSITWNTGSRGVGVHRS
jgi:hypothetical protein